MIPIYLRSYISNRYIYDEVKYVIHSNYIKCCLQVTRDHELWKGYSVTERWRIPRRAMEMDRQLALQENMEAQQELRTSGPGLSI